MFKSNYGKPYHHVTSCSCSGGILVHSVTLFILSHDLESNEEDSTEIGIWEAMKHDHLSKRQVSVSHIRGSHQDWDWGSYEA